MLEGAGAAFDHDAVLAGKLTPVFFGSAVNNFGVQLLLDAFLDLAPAPRPRTVNERVIDPVNDGFSGFIFKIQANMDPRHRDRLAFVRICSGKFERDMSVIHTRTGRKLRLVEFAQTFRPRTRNGGRGVSRRRGGSRRPFGFPHRRHAGGGRIDFVSRRFRASRPECFAWLQSPSTAQFKRFREGLEQLLQEGVVQSFHIKDSTQRVPLLGAVGPLQFEVVQYRMQTEYGAESRLEHGPWKILRWAQADNGAPLEDTLLPTGARLAYDVANQPVLLFTEQWACDFFAERNPKIRLSALPPVVEPVP